MGHEIRVTIAGSTKAGKTTIAELIVRTLRKVGVRCDTSEPGVQNLQDHVAALNAADTHVTVETTGAVKPAPTTLAAAHEVVTPLVALRAQQVGARPAAGRTRNRRPELRSVATPGIRALQLGGEAIRKLEGGR